MSIVRWDPFSELVSLREAMNRLFEDSVVRPTSGLPDMSTARAIAIDMYETKDSVVVKAPMPGVKPEDVDISVTDQVLTIKGEAKHESEVKREDYLIQERRYGTFYRQIALPMGVEADKARATYENGVLELTLPKVEKVKPKTIKVTAKSS